ncbi:MAK10-like protein [Tanacetum coccineum]
MGDKNHIRTLGDYSKPSHEGYQNTIELPVGYNVVPLRTDTIRLVQNGCSFHGLWSEDPNQHLKDFLKLVDSLDLDIASKERTRLRRTAKLRNDILMFQQHQGESLSEAWTHFKDLLQKVPQHGIDRWLEIQISYDHVPFHLKCEIDRTTGNPYPRYLDEPPRLNSSTSHERVRPNPQPQVLGTNFEARVRDYMAAHTKSMERWEEEKSAEDNGMSSNSIVKPDGSDAVVPLKEVKKENKAEKGTKDEPVESAEKKLTQIKEEELVEAPSYQSVGYYHKHKINKNLVEGVIKNQRFNDSLSATRIGGLKHMNALVDQGSDMNVMRLSIYKSLTDERPTETDIKLSLASHSYIYPLGIVEDVLFDVTGYVYLVDFMILDIKEDKKRPFILGTPFLTTAKAVIKFDNGIITLRSRKSKISFHMTPETLCRIEKRTKNDIEPIAPTMTVNRLVLEWEERIKLHQEKEMKFDQ